MTPEEMIETQARLEKERDFRLELNSLMRFWKRADVLKCSEGNEMQYKWYMYFLSQLSSVSKACKGLRAEYEDVKAKTLTSQACDEFIERQFTNPRHGITIKEKVKQFISEMTPCSAKVEEVDAADLYAECKALIGEESLKKLSEHDFLVLRES